jgi:hypothetical protein
LGKSLNADQQRRGSMNTTISLYISSVFYCTACPATRCARERRSERIADASAVEQETKLLCMNS